MVRLKFLLLLLSLLLCGTAFSQDLEPRRWSRLPTGVSFLGFGLGNSTGNIFVDPVLHLEDASLDYTTGNLSFIQTFDFLGKPARVDFNVPYAHGRWEGLLNGEPAAVSREGFADPWMRLSVNLYGAPSLKGKEFAQYMAQHPVNTTVGAGIAVIAPVGEYIEDKLINLGNNRWTLRPQFGVLHEHNKWQFETTAAVFLYGDNQDFYPGTQKLEANPLWSIQAHLIHTFRPGLWASASGVYAWGGRSTIGGVPIDNESQIVGWALSVGVAITRQQGLKLAFTRQGTKADTGSDVDTLVLAWSMILGH